MPPRRRTEKQGRQSTSKQKGQRASNPKPGAVSRSRGKSSRKGPDIQERAYRVFAEQAEPLWNDLTYQCQQFADGFNKALGASALHVQAAPTRLRVAYPRAEIALVVELDKAERYVQATLDTGCAARGYCLTDQPAVGLTVNGNELRFVLAGEVVSNEQLAVALLTKLTSGTSGEGRS